jgi:hypothetical protein
MQAQADLFRKALEPLRAQRDPFDRTSGPGSQQ